MTEKRSNQFDMTMAEFKGSVLAQLQNIQEDITTIDSKVGAYCEKTDKRLNVLELWKTDITARVAVIVAVFTIGINLVWDVIKEKLGIKN
jgi:uncharacterized protein with HEPN domain